MLTIPYSPMLKIGVIDDNFYNEVIFTLIKYIIFYKKT